MKNKVIKSAAYLGTGFNTFALEDELNRLSEKGYEIVAVDEGLVYLCLEESEND